MYSYDTILNKIFYPILEFVMSDNKHLEEIINKEYKLGLKH